MPLKDVKVPSKPKQPAQATITVDSTTGSLFRKLAKHEGLRLTDFLERLIRVYAENVHPGEWIVVEDTNVLKADLKAAENVGGILKKR
jgi:hypothetical protein